MNQEAERLVKKENCTIIIVLSHCGIDVDQNIAYHAGPHISLIVGGHTHTFLYSGENPPGPEKPKGPYPVVVTQKSGKKVLVVQAALNSMYLGNLSVWYNQNGDLVRWEGNPIYLDKNIKQGKKKQKSKVSVRSCSFVFVDPVINAELAEWKKAVDEYGNTILGSSKVLLDRSTRRSGESNIGSFLTDAMVNYVRMSFVLLHFCDAFICFSTSKKLKKENGLTRLSLLSIREESGHPFYQEVSRFYKKNKFSPVFR